MEDIPGYGIVLASDGISYVTLEHDASNPEDYIFYAYLVRNGERKRITTYPSTVEDLAFSPDGMSIAIATNRRSDKQIWWIPL
jgi:Tol biopolymer transport system component